MCNFWLRLESLTTDPFSKQPLLLYKKQTISLLGCQTKISYSPRTLREKSKGLVYSQMKTSKIPNPAGLAYFTVREMHAEQLTVSLSVCLLRWPPPGQESDILKHQGRQGLESTSWGQALCGEGRSGAPTVPIPPS